MSRVEYVLQTKSNWAWKEGFWDTDKPFDTAAKALDHANRFYHGAAVRVIRRAIEIVEDVVYETKRR